MVAAADCNQCRLLAQTELRQHPKSGAAHDAGLAESLAPEQRFGALARLLRLVGHVSRNPAGVEAGLDRQMILEHRDCAERAVEGRRTSA